MDSIANPRPPANDPASAFADLRGEVSLLRRAVEGLTAERKNAPDYTPTLTGMSRRLADIEELLGKVIESPAMQLTPDHLALEIARASETVRKADRETLDTAGATLRTSIARVDGIVEQAWTVDRQLKLLCWTAGAGVFVGVMAMLLIWQLIR